MIYIRPYKRTSVSARLLRDTLNIPFLKTKTKHVLGDHRDVVFNWGGTAPIDLNAKVYNQPDSVAGVVSKRDFLIELKNIIRATAIPELEVVPFCFSKQDATQLFEKYDRVYCRTLIKSSKGRGIVIAKSAEELVDAPLYTAGLSCKREYRVHMFGQTVIDLTAKVKVTDKSHPAYQENPNSDIKNLDTGYVFARNSVKIPDKVRETLHKLGRHMLYYYNLDFGAIDVIRTVDNKFYPIEINTAPGITGTTLRQYAEAFKNIKL